MARVDRGGHDRMGDASFGKYRLIAELGHGGMADVFLAVIAGPAGSNFSKLTVVKRLRQNLADEPEFVEMLVDEARISARLNHPNVVQTNEVGSVGNQYFLAMEYLDGQPLHRIQHRATQFAAKAAANPTPPASGDTPPPSVLMPTDPFPRECQYLVLADTLAGLHHAHELADYDGTPLQIVHRDVTPHNVFVTYEGQVKVVDFGIAKAVGRASETRQGVVKGKVRYMAPEQALGQPVDRRADIFSVGIMLWEAATKRRMWKDMDDLAIVQALVSGMLNPSPREIDPTVPEELDRICRKALAYNRDDRYATAEDMRVDLEQHLSDSGQIVSARRKLGASVSTLFHDKRQEIRTIIEKQLQVLKTQPADVEPMNIPLDANSSGAIVALGPAASSAAVALSVRNSQAPRTDGATEIYTGSSSSGNTGQRQAKKDAFTRLPVLALVAGAVIGITAFAVNRVSASRAETRAAITTTPSAQAQAPDVHVKLTASPPNAAISIDGETVQAPYDARVPRDAREHVIRVDAPGFEPHVEKVKFENDIMLSVTLTKPTSNARPAHSAVAAASPPPKWGAPAPVKATPQASASPTPAPAPSPTVAVTPISPPTATSTQGAKAPKPDIDKGDPWGGNH